VKARTILLSLTMMASFWVVHENGCRGTGEAGLPLRASHALPLSYGFIVREDSNLRPCDHELTALFTTGVTGP
jgi:hypothetical protein